MAAEMALVKHISKFSNDTPKFSTIKMSVTTTSSKPSKKANKTAIKETLLTQRFYTTDFDEMETLFNT
ncbi:putative magnesium-protoporphyrin IX monomethyl ester (oxidative) cyclase [Lupinus albus]|uniref:Putative magnesium-protoporphyrin IX monomethyl ester (Oxidative) cyclase n=1 Tax=Lupinus albus TaxID=3870 RepID=A0A6A4ND43_LUPAL|nr:putative magnesium-protoporphyrin IX monomethyl ester (oxidative) cyclase [Lupinus albus]